uniref:Flagellin_D0/D1 domain-containing protein n=1 Tax=Elaeophora elaphi TaxID=1147741 RepID=A0A0R3RP53_9BILA
MLSSLGNSAPQLSSQENSAFVANTSAENNDGIYQMSRQNISSTDFILQQLIQSSNRLQRIEYLIMN